MTTVLIAPDSFKGSLSATVVASIIAATLQELDPNLKLIQLPLADGGEGSLDLLLAQIPGAQLKKTTVQGALGSPCTARWIWLSSSNTAIIEMAEAAGLSNLNIEQRNPLLTSSYGVGQLINAALLEGASHIVTTLGGTSTVDGGTGLARALGWQFLDDTGEPLPEGGGSLHRLQTIIPPLSAPSCTFTALVDVENPLSGPNGAAAVYAPQKGATEAMVALLEQGLDRLTQVACQTLDASAELIATTPGAGAAGGAATGLALFVGATWTSGAESFLKLLSFEKKSAEIDLIISGEGCLDRQSTQGKLLSALSRQKPPHAKLWVIAGCKGTGWEQTLLDLDIERVAFLASSDSAEEREEAMKQAAKLLAQETKKLWSNNESF